MVKLSLWTTQSTVKKWSHYNTVGSGRLRLNGTIWGLFFRSGIVVTPTHSRKICCVRFLMYNSSSAMSSLVCRLCCHERKLLAHSELVLG